ncbi:MAG TPA: AMP-binding protein [Nocardioidaceae bacterium]|nr:AMP-binding protein [Nocardioidaceae bacterium]
MAQVEFPSTVGRVLERSARRTPTRLALTFDDRRWTYAELDRAAGRVAGRLLELGLTPGDRVAAYGKNSDAYLLLYIGCARAGLVPVLQKLRDQLPGVGFYNCFGQSEIGPLATVLRPEEHDARPDSIGRAVLFVETRVVDQEMNDVAPGEVVYRSPQLCTGYWEKPEETAEAFTGGWFHSGDLVRIDEEGYLFVVDRIKDVVNTGGVLVASRDVEDALYAHPAVAEVAVIGVPDPRWIETIAAVVVVKDEVGEREIIEFAHERLATHKVPKAVHFVDELPKNPSGKLLKRELRSRFGGSESAVGDR